MAALCQRRFGMLDLLTPLFSTGLGIFGAFLQRKHERKMFVEETERMRIEFDQEIKLTDLQMQAKREETEQEIALTETAGNVEAFINSQAAENALSKIQWGASVLGDIANFARSITRPGITWFLVIGTSIRANAYYSMTKRLADSGGQGIDRLEIMGTAFEQMMANPFDLAMVNMTSMVVGWWFGSRGTKTTYTDAHYSRGLAQ